MVLDDGGRRGVCECTFLTLSSLSSLSLALALAVALSLSRPIALSSHSLYSLANCTFSTLSTLSALSCPSSGTPHLTPSGNPSLCLMCVFLLLHWHVAGTSGRTPTAGSSRVLRVNALPVI
eukprot:2166443-Rhodomonas_salina.1